MVGKCIPGGSVTVGVGPDDTTIGGDALSEFAPDLVNLLADVTQHPVLLASEHAITKHHLTPRARVVAAAAAGVAPRIMGIAPVPATQKVLVKTGLELSQIDVVELNEAFAAQALAVIRELGLPDDAAHVNPNGGAIAIGHPLGASGARLATAAVNQLERIQGRYALCTMCVGVGQGIALILERC